MLPQNEWTQEMVFQCQQCGECCSSWKIPIEKEKAEPLLEKPWVQERLREAHLSFEPIDTTTWRLPLTPENFCIFLAPDKRCMIEMKEGRQLKPEQCQKFPFATIRLPSGKTDFEVSHACKSIAEIHLPRKLKTIPAQTEPSFNEELLPIRIKITPFRSTSIPQYEKYLETLAPWLEDDSLSPETALHQVQQLLHHFPDLNTRTSIPIGSFTFHPGLEPFMRASFLRKPYGYRDFFALFFNQEYADPKIFGWGAFCLKPYRSIPWPTALNPLLKTFLHRLLQRKIPLAYGHNLTSILVYTTIAYFITRWYTKTLALLQEKSQPDVSDLTLAIRITERYYTGHQPQFLEFFRTCLWIQSLEALLFKLPPPKVR